MIITASAIATDITVHNFSFTVLVDIPCATVNTASLFLNISTKDKPSLPSIMQQEKEKKRKEKHTNTDSLEFSN